MADSDSDDANMPDLVNDSSGDNSSEDEYGLRRVRSKARKQKAPKEPHDGASKSATKEPAGGSTNGLRKGFLEGSSSAVSSSWTTKELKEMITSAGLNMAGCIDKSDLIDRAREPTFVYQCWYNMRVI